MAYKDLYKDRYGSTKNMDRGYVFGTFPNGKLSYDISRFERDRADGTTIIDLVPECRVFVFGVEVTKDVQSVSIKHSLGGNQCTIQLTNPRDRYVVTKQDLVGNWREDKDFLATYNYDYLNRIPPSRPDLLSALSKNTRIGKYGHTLGDQMSQFASYFKPTKSPVTRMIFETKFFSGIDKRTGDFIFDYRDPVMVFMKGRFSPYWYFAFTGVIESWDESDAYGTEQAISMRCEDPLYLFKRTKFTHRASLLPAGNYETALYNMDSKNRLNIYKKRFGDTHLEEAIKILFFGSDRYALADNCHPLFSEFNKKAGKDADAKDMKKVRKILEEDYNIGKASASFNFKDTESDLMLSYGQNPSKWWWATAQKPTGYVVPISKINKGGIQDGKLNTWPLSPWYGLYTQLNVINLPEYNAEELMARYTSTVRFWEVAPQMGTARADPSNDFSGWQDSGSKGESLAIGAAGIHPALTYEFINHFNILPGIWEQLNTVKGKGSEVNPAVDTLNISPHDKIRELVVGSPTENRPEVNSGGGTNVNLFRPRVFVVIPKKFTNENRAIMATAFGQLSFLQQDATTRYDALKEVCAAIQFSFYSSPMGDIFIEPEMHDFHPTEILVSSSDKIAKIEKRSIVEKQKSVKFRAIITGVEKKDLSDLAYMYNSKANHPFFLMEKDRIRCTQTFKPENIKTHIVIKGSAAELGGIVDDAFNLSSEFVPLFGGGYDIKKDAGLNPGVYIADGFGFNVDRNKLAVDSVYIDLKIEYLTRNYRKSIWSEFIDAEYNSTFITIFKEAAASIKTLANSNSAWKPEILKLAQLLITAGKFDTPSTSSQSLYGMSLTEGEIGTILLLAKPTLDIIAQEQALRGNAGAGLDATQKAAIHNDTTYNAFSNIQGTSIIKNWLRATNQEQVAKVTAKLNDQGPKKKGQLETIAEIVRSDLLNLYEPILLVKNPDIIKKFEEIVTVEESKNTLIPKVLTLGTLKKLEKSGLYNPRLDVGRKYGYNKGPEITNMMINNGAEAARYAVTMFNKLYSQAHRISMDIIGRPELLLNKPYYCERKDAIGLLENYSLNFSIGSDFQTSLELTYVRKNSLTYNYSLGTLDELVGTTKNSYFAIAAQNYFKSTATISNNITNKMLTRSLSAAGNIIGRTIAKGDASKTPVSTATKLKGKGFSGGLYSAHDKIGHMEYNLLGTDSKVSKSGGKSEITDPKLKILAGLFGDDIEALAKITNTISIELKINFDELVKIEMDYDTMAETIKNQEEKVVKLKTKVSALTDKSNHKANTINKALTSAEQEVSNLKKEQARLLEAHKTKCFKIYGVEKSKINYTNSKNIRLKNEPAGDRIPEITTVEDLTLNTMDKESLFYKFYKLLDTYKVPTSRIKLIDDRTVGHTLKGFETSLLTKLGWKGTTPFYASIKIGE